MGTRYLLDTSVVVKFLQQGYELNFLEKIKQIVDNEIIVSFVTRIELLSYNPPFSSPEIVAYKENVAKFISKAEILGINDSIIEETIRIRKTVKTKLPDSLIGATAIVCDFTLLSDNDSDFLKIVPLGLHYQNPLYLQTKPDA